MANLIDQWFDTYDNLTWGVLAAAAGVDKEYLHYLYNNDLSIPSDLRISIENWLQSLERAGHISR